MKKFIIAAVMVAGVAGIAVASLTTTTKKKATTEKKEKKAEKKKECRRTCPFS